MKLAFIHRGSKTCREIIEATRIPRYRRGVRPEVIINYGVVGERLTRWRELNPWGSRLPMINKPHSFNKLQVVGKAQEMGVQCPVSRLSLERRHDPSGWLVKPFYSKAGRGIEIAEERNAPYGKYFQEFIHDRIYELRVHAFKWMPSEEWAVQKRVEGEEESITWNHHTGGRFITVNDTTQRVFTVARDYSTKVLEVLGMGFGGVDFVVSEDREVYFIEINSAVGVQELSLPIYVEAFEKLRGMEVEDVEGYAV